MNMNRNSLNLLWKDDKLSTKVESLLESLFYRLHAILLLRGETKLLVGKVFHLRIFFFEG